MYFISLMVSKSELKSIGLRSFPSREEYEFGVMHLCIYLGLSIYVIHLWHPPPSPPCPYPHHLQKWTTNLLFKSNRIRRHVTNFKTSLPPFHVDVINVWSLAFQFWYHEPLKKQCGDSEGVMLLFWSALIVDGRVVRLPCKGKVGG